MSMRRDPHFGRFVFTVATVGLVVIVLGLSLIWYVMQSGGVGASAAPIMELFRRSSRVPPGRIMLYLTKDGRQLIGTVVEMSDSGMSPSEKARNIVTRLIEGRGAAMLSSPIPPDTKLQSVFINGRVIIVNFSREYMTKLKGGVDAEMLAVYSVVNSLLFNIESADAVQILVEGEKPLTIGGHIDVSEPLIANTVINRPS